jgi:hypothetical protein
MTNWDTISKVGMGNIHKINIAFSLFQNVVACFLTRTVSTTQRFLWRKELGSQRLEVFLTLLGLFETLNIILMTRTSPLKV